LDCLMLMPARDLLAEYVRDTFRFPVSNTVPETERQQGKEAVALIAADSILNHWSFPEDCHAFRRYVKNKVRIASRGYYGTLDPSSCGRARYENRGETIEPSWDTGQPRTIPLRAETPEEMTVADAADHLQRSPSYVHRLIREGRIPTLFKNGQRRLQRQDIEHVSDALARRNSWLQERRKLELSGRTASAARKAAYRALGPIPRI